MQKLIVLEKQLNNCEWEIELSSYKVSVICEAKAKLKALNIKYKVTIYKEVITKHPYKIKFSEIDINSQRISVSSNILNCLENDKITNEEVIIRKGKDCFTVYLWEISEVEAFNKATELYRLHKEYLLRQSV